MTSTPVERRADYQHLDEKVKRLVFRMSAVGAISGAVLATAAWLGWRSVSPAESVEAVATQVRRVEVRMSRVEEDHGRLGERVDFLVVAKCGEMDGPTRRLLEAAGFSCARTLQEIRGSNGNHEWEPVK